MIMAWMLHALVVGLLVGAGALVLESLLRAHRLPTRWIWVGAMLLSILWPLAQLVLEHWPARAAATGAPGPAAVVALDPLVVQVGPESILRVLDRPALVFWLVATLLLLGGCTVLLLRTRRLIEGWQGEEAEGRMVLISEDWGPAVVGFLQPRIVLPSWCRNLDASRLKLILEHEVEHLRAGDLRLILTLGALPILLPWHLLLWWQYARLRLAVEGDCDLRVVGRDPRRRRPYLELLLDVGGRARRSPALATMLSEPEEVLKRRIRIMTMPMPKKPWVRGVLLGTAGLLLVALACWAPSPMGSADDTSSPTALDAVSSVEEGGPTFTPYTVKPDIKNRDELARALEREYPPLLRDAGIGGTATVWFLVGEDGVVRRLMVDKSSGHKALDDAALRVAASVLFTPALNKDKPVPVWISLPITFRVGGGEAPESKVVTQVPVRTPGEASSLPEPPAAGPPDLEAAPTFTPYTVKPDIKNRDELARALDREYPPLLRDAGIGGTAAVWFFIDQTGRVQKTQIDHSTGHKALDEAALRIADAIQFTPALNRGEAVPVWISLPITFKDR